MWTLSQGVDQNLRDHYGALGIEELRQNKSDACASLELQIQEFERQASNLHRFRGSSA